MINRSGDMTSIVERNEAHCYLYSLAHTHNRAKKAVIAIPKKNITVPKSIGTASDDSTLLQV